MSSSTHTATWNGVEIARSDKCEKVEGNWYFPPDSINKEYFEESTKTTVCGWKGIANYYNIRVNGKVNADACWVYRSPKEAAKNISGYLAFWKGVEVK